MAGKDDALLRAIGGGEPTEVERQRIGAEIDRAIAWLQSKWSGNGDAVACPYCKHNSWSVGPPLELVTRRSAMAPMFPVVCDTCGHTTFVSAVISGLMPEPGTEP